MILFLVIVEGYLLVGCLLGYQLRSMGGRYRVDSQGTSRGDPETPAILRSRDVAWLRQ